MIWHGVRILRKQQLECIRNSSSVCPCVHCPPRKICFGFLTISQERNSYRRSVGLKTTGFFRAFMISAWVTWSEPPKGTKDRVKQVQSLPERLPPGRLPDFYVIYFLQVISKDLWHFYWFLISFWDFKNLWNFLKIYRILEFFYDSRRSSSQLDFSLCWPGQDVRLLPSSWRCNEGPG